MKKLPVLLIAVFVIGVVGSACRDDVVLPPPESLVGDWVGTYTYKTGEGVNADSSVQAIKWVFTETNYIMDADTTADGFNETVCFCKGRGTYAITDRVRLEPTSDRPLPDYPCNSCDPELSAQGLFALERPSGGIKLTQIDLVEGVQVTKTVLLVRAPETE